MPTLRHSPDDIAREAHIPSRFDPRAVATAHIYLAATLLVILGAVRFFATWWRTSGCPGCGEQSASVKQKPRHLSFAEAAGEKSWHRFEPSFRTPTRGFVPLRVVPGQHQPLGKPPTMDGNERETWEDHYPWSALSASRGVSTSSPKPLQTQSPVAGSVTVTDRTRRSCSPRTSSRASSGKRHSCSSSDGLDGQPSKRKGKTPMAGSSGHITHGHAGPPHCGLDGHASPGTDGPLDDIQPRASPFRDNSFSGVDLSIPRHFSRPPPPPPLTPPTAFSGAFPPFGDHPPSYAAPTPPTLDMSFIHQPNPEYGGCSSSTDVLSSSPQSATAFPRRRSYTKNVPTGIGVPAPAPSTTTPASSSTTETTSESAPPTSSPPSYPPTSSPPAGPYEPPSAPPEYEFVGGPGGPGVFLSQQEIDLQGEIISVVDDAGHGWKRHTRVYGGGVCLACVAAAERDGGLGGFYGDKVPLEDRR